MSRVHVSFDKRGEVFAYRLVPRAVRFSRFWKCMMLAPSLEVCGALLAGQQVPVARLDPKWVDRFGVRDD